jgi:hypothetical protein
MPGLSQYRPRYAPPDENGIYQEDPTVTGEWDDKPSLFDLADAMQRSKDVSGFADPARSFGDQVFHGLYNNVPREMYDKNLTFTDDEDNDYKMTFRALMDLAKGLSPLDPRSPMYERQNP